MNFAIVFSGGCFSGKTTTIKSIKKFAENEMDCEVVILNEAIRTATDKSIDEVRKNPSEYLKLQEKIICTKISQEEKIFNSGDGDCLYLIDRAITDSLFYLQNYVDKSRLSDEDMLLYCKLHKKVIEHAEKAFKHGYFLVLEFEPIENRKNNDSFRPKLIDSTKYYEHDAISILNSAFMSKRSQDLPGGLIKIDLNSMDAKYAYTIIKNKIYDTIIK